MTSSAHRVGAVNGPIRVVIVDSEVSIRVRPRVVLEVDGDRASVEVVV